MKNWLIIILITCFAVKGFGQIPGQHFIKFVHVGEKILPVPSIYISYQNARIYKDSDEMVLDTLTPRFIRTDEKTYRTLLNYVIDADFRLARRGTAGILDFGTFKIIYDHKYYFLSANSVTPFFKKLVLYLRKKKIDPALVQDITDNYPWLFNP